MVDSATGMELTSNWWDSEETSAKKDDWWLSKWDGVIEEPLENPKVKEKTDGKKPTAEGILHAQDGQTNISRKEKMEPARTQALQWASSEPGKNY